MSTDTPRYELVIDWLGKPTTLNAAHRMHHHAASRDRKRWREAGAAAVNLRGGDMRGLDAITVTAQGRYPNARSLPPVVARGLPVALLVTVWPVEAP